MPLPEHSIIPLSKGQVALVSLEDYERISQWKWSAAWSDGTKSYYAKRTDFSGVKPTTVAMHRVVMGLNPGDKREVDHVFHDTLDNRRDRLRIVTHRENVLNQRRSIQRRMRMACEATISNLTSISQAENYGATMKKPPTRPEPSGNSTVDAIRAFNRPLTVKELSKITGLSIFTLYDWAKANPPRIPRMLFGIKIAFDPQVTADWLQERCG